jgi:hypothetical protein
MCRRIVDGASASPAAISPSLTRCARSARKRCRNASHRWPPGGGACNRSPAVKPFRISASAPGPVIYEGALARRPLPHSGPSLHHRIRARTMEKGTFGSRRLTIEAVWKRICSHRAARRWMRDHAAVTASHHRFAGSARKIRSVERETRWCWRSKVLWMAACMPRNGWAERADLNRCILRSCRRTA